MGGFFLLLGLGPLLHHHTIRLWACGVAIPFVFFALVAPSVLRPLNKLWFALGIFLNRVVSPIVMGAMFLLIITPFGLVLRALRQDLLGMAPKPKQDSYWIPRQPPGPPGNTLRNQF